MPQVKLSLALIYAVNPFCADHRSHEHDPGYTTESAKLSLERMARFGLTVRQPERALNREKAKFVLHTEWNYSFLDTADYCQFVFGPSWQLYGPDEMVELARAATGWQTTIAEIQRIGERRLTLLRLFNAREGVGREQDALPKRFFDKPLTGGASDGVSVMQMEFQMALGGYFELAGWDKRTGMPTQAKLEELGLDDWV
jgi:aldehyde:ferredoxin oxidoreductase